MEIEFDCVTFKRTTVIYIADKNDYLDVFVLKVDDMMVRAKMGPIDVMIPSSRIHGPKFDYDDGTFTHYLSDGSKKVICPGEIVRCQVIEWLVEEGN